MGVGDKAAEKLIAGYLKEQDTRLDERIKVASVANACTRAEFEAGYREGLRVAGWLEERAVLRSPPATSVSLQKLDGSAQHWHRVGAHPYREDPPTAESPSVPGPRRRWSAFHWINAASVGGLATAFAASALPHANAGFPLFATLYVFLGTLVMARAFLADR